MPNQTIEGNYRYAYQGQEKDPETGMEAFELRLWDARIGRWLTTDPYSQYHSPYLGMGNNPAIGVDPDGGKVIIQSVVAGKPTRLLYKIGKFYNIKRNGSKIEYGHEVKLTSPRFEKIKEALKTINSKGTGRIC